MRGLLRLIIKEWDSSGYLQAAEKALVTPVLWFWDSGAGALIDCGSGGKKRFIAPWRFIASLHYPGYIVHHLQTFRQKFKVMSRDFDLDV